MGGLPLLASPVLLERGNDLILHDVSRMLKPYNAMVLPWLSAEPQPARAKGIGAKTARSSGWKRDGAFFILCECEPNVFGILFDLFAPL